jgi:class 3 adenylate cyclase/ABC-type transport system substrate-binding protein/outer membrane protein assembly factor BamB
MDGPSPEQPPEPPPVAPPTTENRTFLIADIRGYTKFTREYGDEAGAELAGNFASVVREVVGTHEGFLLELRGDEALCVFVSARRALRCAVDLQERIKTLGLPRGIGIGLDAGEAIPVEGGYRGSALNLAARLCSLAGPGETIASETVIHLAAHLDGIRYVDPETVRVKGFEPVRAVRVVPASEAPRRLQRSMHRFRRRATRYPRAHPVLAAAFVTALAVAIVLVAVSLRPPGTVTPRPDPLAAGNLPVLAFLDPQSGRVTATLALRHAGGDGLYQDGSYWIQAFDPVTLNQIEPGTHRLIYQFPAPFNHASWAYADGTIWWADGDGPGLIAVDARTREKLHDFRLPFDSDDQTGNNAIAIGAGSIWLLRPDARDGSEVVRLDPNSGAIQKRIAIETAYDIAFGAGGVWISGGPSAQLTRINPVTNELAKPTTLGGSPRAIGFGNDAAWTTDSQQGLVWKVDRSGVVVGTYTTGAGAHGPNFGDGVMWIANEDDGSVTGIDVVTGAMQQHYLGHRVRGVVAGPELVVAVDQTFEDDLSLLPNGPVLTVLGQQSEVDPLDPAILSGPFWYQLFHTSCISLLNYPDKPGAAGLELQPEAAAAMPVVSADGRTYTFTIRSGFRFSPPSNEAVTAETFRFSLERLLSPKLGPDFSPTYLSGILGVQEYIDGEAQNVRGLAANGDVLTIRLVKPDPALLWKLALSQSCPVPLGTPVAFGGIDPDPPIPAAGPYYPAKHADGYVIFRKNPNYHAGRPQPFEAIAVRFGLDPRDSVAKVTAGTFDAMVENFYDGAGVLNPQGIVAGQWGPDSDAAQGGDQRWWGALASGAFALSLNPQSPPFDDINVRRAVALALDRANLAQAQVLYALAPTGMLLPPPVLGTSAEESVPLPDPAAARLLVKEGTAQAVSAVTPTTSCPLCLSFASNVANDLIAIGLDVRIIQTEDRVGEAHKPGTSISMMGTGDIEEYPDPVPILDGLMNQTGWAGDARFAELERIKQLFGAERLAAAAALAKELSEADLILPLGFFVNSMYLSDNVGCAFVQPGMATVDLLGLCPKD